MKFVARWSLILTVALVAGFFSVQKRVKAAPAVANNSQERFIQEIPTKKTVKAETNINNEQSAVNIPTDTSDDKKLIKKTVMVTKRAAMRTFRATAYCLKGRTATGGGVRRGIVAADTRVLPLGTKVYVDAGAYSGTYTVTDTGGAVRGNILDIWVPSCSEANRFGRKSIGVSVMQ